MGLTINDRWITSSPGASSHYQDSDPGFGDPTSLPHSSRDVPCTSSSYSATISEDRPSTSKYGNIGNPAAASSSQSTSRKKDYKTQSLPNPKYSYSTSERPRSCAEDAFSNRTSRKQKTGSFSSFDQKNAYDSSSLSSCGSNQSRNSDYSFLGGKDEYVLEKKSTTTILASSSKSSEPHASSNFKSPDIKHNVQGYERTEGKTVVKTVRTLSVKKFDRPPQFLEYKATTP